MQTYPALFKVDLENSTDASFAYATISTTVGGAVFGQIQNFSRRVGLAIPFDPGVAGYAYAHVNCYDKDPLTGGVPLCPEYSPPPQILIGHFDVAITDVQFAKAVVGRGYDIDINVTTANIGNVLLTFNLTVYTNATYVASQNVTLSSATSTTITFLWGTTDFAEGNYTINAYAWPVPGETHTADNNYTGGCVKVTIPGDVTNDTAIWIDMQDISIIIDNFMAKPPDWNPNCDVNGDLIIDMADISIAIDNFMKAA
jgi:hypothetical protein